MCKKEELVGQNNIVDMRARGLTNGNVDQADTRESTLELLVPCQLALFYPHTHKHTHTSEIKTTTKTKTNSVH